MSAVELRVLGPLEVFGDEDGPIKLAAAKERRLLAALAVKRGKPASVDWLIDAVWGEAPPASSRKLLHVYVSKLRRALPPGVEIATGSGGYALVIPADAVDADRFERLVEEGRAALDLGNPALATSLLRRALSLWRGRAYSDVVYDDFARGEADRLEELRLVALEVCLDAELRVAASDDLLGRLRALAAEHPMRERLQGQLMLALYRAGRHTEALDSYAQFRDRMRDELGLDPGPELDELQGRILRHDPSLLADAPPSRRVSLPEPANRLLGRARELSQLQHLLARPDARLIVLAGAGGSGKTRLALELARVAAPTFANGVAFVELAALNDDELVAPTMLHALGIAEVAGQDPADTLVTALVGQELLLVVDNAEQLTTAATTFVRIVTHAPRVKIVITSRRVLHLSGENVFPVPPLEQDDGVRLFVERAQALEPGFALDEEAESDVREICRRLDGLPLAIELAAARVNMLSVGALRRRLADRLSVLTSGAHDLPARQRTLRATIEWSVDLLSPEERTTFARLSVFAGAFTLEAAEAVCDATLEHMAALVDQSLVQKRGERYAMLQVVHEFAAGLLSADAGAARLRDRHAGRAVEIAETGEASLGGPEQSAWLKRLDDEHDDIRAAQEWLTTAGDASRELRLAASIGRYRYLRGFLAEGRASIEAALSRGAAEPPEIRAKACRVASAISVLQGDWDGARALAEDGLRLYERAGDRAGVARSLSNLGAILIGSGDDEAAAATLDRAVALARELGDDRILALSLNNRGDVALTRHEWPRAADLFTESLALLQRMGDEANIARSLFNLGAAKLEQHLDEEAAHLLGQSLDHGVRVDDKEDTAWCLIALGALADRSGTPQTGATLLGAAETLLETMGAKMKPYERDLYERIVAGMRETLGDDSLARYRETGRAMSLADAIMLARGTGGG